MTLTQEAANRTTYGGSKLSSSWDTAKITGVSLAKATVIKRGSAAVTSELEICLQLSEPHVAEGREASRLVSSKSEMQSMN